MWALPVFVEALSATSCLFLLEVDQCFGELMTKAPYKLDNAVLISVLKKLLISRVFFLIKTCTVQKKLHIS